MQVLTTRRPVPDQVNPRRRRRSDIRVCDLANELSASSDEILQLARNRHVWAKSPNTKIRIADADHLRLVWHTRRAVRQQSAEEYASRDQEAEAIRRNLGLPAGHHSRLPGPADRSGPLTGTAACAARHWPGLSKKAAQQIAADWTGLHLLDDAEAAAWWRAGLTRGEAELAATLTTLGIKPSHLRLTIRRETMLYRLRDGLAPEQVVRLLRNEGLL
jgi:hypothetical protein